MLAIKSYLEENLDKVLAVCGALSALTLSVTLFVIYKTLIHSLLLIVVTGSCIFYLFSRHSLGGHTEHLSIPLSSNQILWLNIAYVYIFLMALILVITRSSLYSRPVAYFICVALLSGILGYEIGVTRDRKNYQYLILLKIMLLGVLVRLVPLSMFPGFVWFDPWYHENFISALITTARIPQVGSLAVYSRHPVMHLFAATGMLLSGSDYRFFTLYILIPLQVIVNCLAVYLFVSEFIGRPGVALMSALLVAISDVIAAQGMLPYPNTLAAMLVFALMLLLFLYRKKESSPLALLCIVFMATLLFTHTLGAFMLALILLILWITPILIRPIYPVRSSMVTFSLFALFLIAMLSWWIYGAGQFKYFINVLRWAFDVSIFNTPPPEQAILYASKSPVLEVFMDRLGYFLLYAFAFIGFLFLTNKRGKNIYALLFAIIGLVMTSVGFLGTALKAFVIPNRWYFIGELFISIPAAIGILLVSSLFQRYKSLFVFLLTTTLTFSMLTAVTVNFDTNIFVKSRQFRYALTQSEIASMDTIVEQFGNGKFASDQHAVSYLANKKNAPAAEFADALSDKNFSGLDGDYLFVRNYILTGAFYTRGVLWRLDDDPTLTLLEGDFSQVYESDAGKLFVKLDGRK